MDPASKSTSSKIVAGGVLVFVGRRTGCGFGGLSRGLTEAKCMGVPCLSIAAPAAIVALTDEGARLSAGREEVLPRRPSGTFGAFERLEADRLALPLRIVSLILSMRR